MSRWKLLAILLCSTAAMGCSSAPPNIGGVKADQIVILKSKHDNVRYFVRRAKARFSSGCKSRPANIRSSR
ncbi:MAG: hypothetical protein WBQ02_12480 [Terracidiphilus sp.]